MNIELRRQQLINREDLSHEELLKEIRYSYYERIAKEIKRRQNRIEEINGFAADVERNQDE